MSRIFISYKRVDKDEVFKIKDQIESALGEKCWIDLDGIESDAQFANVIIKAINECEVFLFMYSAAHSQITDYKNDWTVRELDFAQHKKKRIVFVNLDGSPLSDWFYMLFGTMQQVDATSSESLTKLIRDMGGWLKDVPRNHLSDDKLMSVFFEIGYSSFMSIVVKQHDFSDDTAFDDLKDLLSKIDVDIEFGNYFNLPNIIQEKIFEKYGRLARDFYSFGLNSAILVVSLAKEDEPNIVRFKEELLRIGKEIAIPQGFLNQIKSLNLDVAKQCMDSMRVFIERRSNYISKCSVCGTIMAFDYEQCPNCKNRNVNYKLCGKAL